MVTRDRGASRVHLPGPSSELPGRVFVTLKTIVQSLLFYTERSVRLATPPSAPSGTKSARISGLEPLRTEGK